MSKPRILIVDDKEENRYFLRTLLQSNGYEAAAAAHGAEALELARRNPPALIIADVLMPVMDGFALCREWKKDAQLGRIPFIFYTATYTDERDRKFALGLGAERFIVKPEEPEAFLAIVQETLRQAGGGTAAPGRPAAPAAGQEERVFLKQYNEALVRKLEDKMADLEQANRTLEQDIAERRRTEAELRESQATYRSLFANMMNSVVHARMIFRDGAPVDMEYLSVNPAFAEVSGIAAPVVGRRISEVIPGYCENNPESLRIFGQVAATGQPTRWEHYLRELDRWFSFMVYSPARGEIVIVSENITERKRAEEALRSSKAFLDMIIDMSPFAMWVSDATGTVTRVNRSLCEAIHLAPDRIVGHYRVFADANLDKQGVMPQVRAVFEKHEPARFSIPWQAARAGEVDFRGARDLHLDVSMFPILDAQGQLTHVVCQWVDITERKRAEETLHESEERFRALVDGAPDGIFVQSEGRFLFLNPAMAHLLGAAGPEELLGKEILPRIAPEFHPAVRERIRLQTETKNPSPPMEQEYLRLDGARVPVETAAVPFRYQGREAHLVFIRDVTTRRKVELQRELLQTQLTQAQKMESVGRLAGGVAHDFNNMLGAILGHAEMALEDMPPSHPLYANLVEILKATKRSAGLTRQLLAFARKQTAAPQVLDLNKTVEEILKMLQRLIGEDINLCWVPAPDLWPVKIDPSQVDQILTNLCVNARDAITGVGKVTIETGIRTFDDAHCAQHAGFAPGEYVLLAVSDNGCGMDKDTQSKLFEPFFTTKGVGHGTGLGLATVYGIVRQNNGFIYVYSEPGKGTTFHVYLPRHVGQIEPVRTPGAAESAARGQETVLLVEDEPAILSTTKTMLERLGYRVLGAATPGEAIRLANANPGEIQLLMTDVVMPEMNGRDLAQKLLALHPRLKHLYMSGYTANVIAHHGVLHAGVNFIQKPFTMKDLSAKMREVLDGKSPGP